MVFGSNGTMMVQKNQNPILRMELNKVKKLFGTEMGVSVIKEITLMEKL